MAKADVLTEKQEAFCQYYAQLSDTYGNGVWSYALGYGHDLVNADKDNEEWEFPDKSNRGKLIKASDYSRMYNMCGVEANSTLRIPKVIARINELKSTWVEDDKIIDSRMMDIIQKGKDTDALAAIKHRNELKQRITKKLDLTTQGESLNPYNALTAEELRKLAEGK